jgi:hypothetical protein
LAHEWVILTNLLLLLLGFALLSKHFEKSRVPLELPRILPDDWKAASCCCGSCSCYRLPRQHRRGHHRRHHGGRRVPRQGPHRLPRRDRRGLERGRLGSVVGDTTTTMMWIDGVSPLHVLDAYVAAVAAMLFMGYFAARQQHAYSPIVKDAPPGLRIDWRGWRSWP